MATLTSLFGGRVALGAPHCPRFIAEGTAGTQRACLPLDLPPASTGSPSSSPLRSASLTRICLPADLMWLILFQELPPTTEGLMMSEKKLQGGGL